MEICLRVDSRTWVRALTVCALALGVGSGLGVAPARSQSAALDPQELAELNAASFETQEADRVIGRARALIAPGLDPNYERFLRQIIVRSLLTSRAPIKAIAASADTLGPMFAEDARSVVQFHGFMAGAFLDRDANELAYTHAKRALDACPDAPAWAPLRAMSLATLGSAQVARGMTKEGIASLNQALPMAPDSHAVLIALGKAYERTGKPDQAINAYVRALGTFPCKDTTARANAVALAGKTRNGPALDARIEAACATSRNRVALEPRRHERPAPDWELRDLDGKAVRFADLKGKVVVIDFWGSWCGPCRAELPYFQAMYERYRDKGVAFIGIAWERVQTREEAVRASKRFLEQNKLDFPTVVDHERTAVDAFAIESFPTVFLIDKAGMVRYRNVGFTQDIDTILEAQVESLLQ